MCKKTILTVVPASVRNNNQQYKRRKTPMLFVREVALPVLGGFSLGCLGILLALIIVYW